MPTDCDPCPGNTNASFMLMPSHCRQSGAPGETAADALHHHAVARTDLPGAHELVERERHRCGGGIGMVIDRDHQLLARQTELARGRVENAYVGLVRYE